MIAPRAEAAATTSRARTSAMLLMPVAFHAVIVTVTGLIVPIQLSLPASNATPGAPTACKAGNVFGIMPR